jgi:succinyl-CoA synthetase beta subunit
LVLKAQVLGGRRGKQGGIRFVDGVEQCSAEVPALLSSRVGEHSVESVYVEERLNIDRELYVAFTIDRDRRVPLLLASARGGVEIDAVEDTAMVRLAIDPFLGMTGFGLRHVTNSLGLEGEAAIRTASTIRSMYEAFRDEDAELVEVNPLVVTTDRRVVAADAKVTLDDEAGFRHSDRPSGPRSGTEFERACSSVGTVGVELDADGDIAIVVSGAGLMMATIDLLGAAGVRLRGAVDLTGRAFGTPSELEQVMRVICSLSPKIILVNAFFNLAFGDRLAEGVVRGLADVSSPPRVIVRLNGRNRKEAGEILSAKGIPMVDGLAEAVNRVVRLTEEMGSSRS